MTKQQITVAELLEKHSKSEHPEIVLKKYVEVRQYVPFSVKRDLAKEIIKQSCYDKSGNINIDSVRKFYLTAMTLVGAYTNITVDPLDWLRQYDLLVSTGIFNYILNAIPEEEHNTFENVIAMTYDDVLTNATIARSSVDHFIKILGGVLAAAKDGKVPQVTEVPIKGKVTPIDDKLKK